MAIITNATPAIEQTRITTISHMDDAATPEAAKYAIGYLAKYVCVDNVTDRIKFEWYEGMAEGSAIKTVATGVRTLETAGGITVTDKTVGFVVIKDKQYRIKTLG